jgi:Leucine-rich repeat (LRR) protein
MAMKSLRPVLFSLLILLFIAPRESSGVPAQDSLALVDLYNSTDGPNWSHNDNWLTGKVYQWWGVTVSYPGNRVTELDLSSNLLSGTIPASIGDLTALEILDLSWNGLIGPIPEEIGGLTGLVELNLEYNPHLTGSLPGTIGNLIALEFLNVHGDSLTGPIPATIGSLTKLQTLNLSNNRLSSSIPATIGGLADLTELNLTVNQLTGSIPPEISGLSKLETLNLSSNQLTGSIPEQIGALSSLTHCYLSANQLEGEIPGQIGQLSNLSTLYLGQNQLTGSIPEEIGGMTNLMWLFMNDNALSGAIPAAIGDLTALDILHLYNNQLSGAVPDEITQLTLLTSLFLQNNRLEAVPDLHPLTAMSDLRVENNRLTFKDIEPNVGVSSWMFIYSPQDSIGTRQDTLVAVGDPVSLTLSAGGTQTNYQWMKNDQNIPGATDSTCVIASVAAGDSGRYECLATNTVATELYLYSLPIHLSVPHISNPAAGDLWIAGQKDTVRWSMPGGNVSIALSLDGGQTFAETIGTSLANTGQYLWDIPDSTLSRKSVLQIESDGKPGTVVTSDEFKIKPYVLTRLTPEGQYEKYEIDEDAWSFANDDTIMWPESWWGGDPPRFDYINGIDPFTMQEYPFLEFDIPIELLGTETFPDWPLFVSAFGVDQCYWDVEDGLYRQAALEHWKSVARYWGGSCTGFAVSSLMAFDDSSRFREAFPVGNFHNLRELSIDDERRKVINLLWTRQTGNVSRQYWRDNWDKTPTETLDEIQQMLLSEVRDDRTLTMVSRHRTGSHRVCPISVEVDFASGWIGVYDNEYPDTLRYISIDLFGEEWSYPYISGYEGSDGLFLRGPVSDYYNEAILPKCVVVDYQPVVARADTGDAVIEFFNTPGAFITIYDQSGDSIGFADSATFEGLPGGIPIIPETGSYHPPIGYSLPSGEYSVRMSRFDEPYAYFRAFGDSVIFDYARADADSTQSDRLAYGDGFGLSNPDGMSKHINLQTIMVEESDEKVFDVMNAAVAQDDSLHLEVINRRDLKMANAGSAKSYDLRLRLTSASKHNVFRHEDVALGGNSSHLICPDWDDLPDQPVIIYIDDGDDGSIDDSLAVDNEYTNVEEQGSLNVPTEYALSQNYPNPFNAGTELNYSLPRSSQVTLAVYNILGQRVVTLVQGIRQPGRYQVRWDAADLSSGIYFARLEAGEYSRTVKMLLLR